MHILPAAAGRQLAVRSPDEYGHETDCTPQDSFVQLSFGASQLVRSNLGGRGGQCEPEYIADLGACVEAYSPTQPPEIYIRNIGTNKYSKRFEAEGIYDQPGFNRSQIGLVIDLTINNLTEYRSWENNGRKWNGVTLPSAPHSPLSVSHGLS